MNGTPVDKITGSTVRTGEAPISGATPRRAAARPGVGGRPRLAARGWAPPIGRESYRQDVAPVLGLLDRGERTAANELFDEILRRSLHELPGHALARVLSNQAIAALRLDRVPLALELAAEAWATLDAEQDRPDRPDPPDHRRADDSRADDSRADSPPADAPEQYRTGDRADDDADRDGTGAGRGEPESDAAALDGAHALQQLGHLLDNVGRRTDAIEMHRRAVAIAIRCGDPALLARCLMRLGGTINLLGTQSTGEPADRLFREAEGHLRAGLALRVEDEGLRLSLQAALARSLVHTGRPGPAELLAEEVVRRTTAPEHATGRVIGTAVLAEVRVGQRRLPEALDLLAHCTEVALRLNNRSMVMATNLRMADVARMCGDTEVEVVALRRIADHGVLLAGTLREALAQAFEQRRVARQALRAAALARLAATRDTLTGLANRFGLEEQADELLAAAVRQGRVPWLIVVDVDNFKAINDTAGHPCGDQVLREVAGLLRRECRTEDLVVRWAGDEFVVLGLGPEPGTEAGCGPVVAGEVEAGSGSGVGTGLAVAERIRAAVAGCDWNLVLGPRAVGPPVSPTVSVGVAAGGGPLDQLFSDADVALYQAKRQGRDRVVGHERAAPERGESGGRESGGRESGGRESGGGGRESGGRESGGRESGGGGRESGGRESGGRESGGGGRLGGGDTAGEQGT